MKRPKTGGRQKGTPNKTTAQLKDLILQALSDAGGVEYLTEMAREAPAAFLALLGKVLPMQIAQEPADAFRMSVIERVIVRPQERDKAGPSQKV